MQEAQQRELVDGAEGRRPRLGRHYLSNATCPIRPHLFYVFRHVKDHLTLPKYSSLLKNACVRQVMLDKWFPLTACASAAGSVSDRSLAGSAVVSVLSVAPHKAPNRELESSFLDTGMAGLGWATGPLRKGFVGFWMLSNVC